MATLAFNELQQGIEKTISTTSEAEDITTLTPGFKSLTLKLKHFGLQIEIMYIEKLALN